MGKYTKKEINYEKRKGGVPRRAGSPSRPSAENESEAQQPILLA
jgi:hypothetical protein